MNSCCSDDVCHFPFPAWLSGQPPAAVRFAGADGTPLTKGDDEAGRGVPKISRQEPLRLLSGTILFAALNAGAAIGLTVAPPALTNGFVGRITLTITNLTAGQAVLVESRADLNGNGVLDAGEPIVWSLPVTDGQAPAFGGVRNLNVPGDEDGTANGRISMEFAVPDVGGPFNIAGGFIFQVVDPAGHVPLASLPYTIVPRPYPQGVTGRITAAATGLPLTNTLVGLLGSLSPFPYFTVTDSNGDFSCFTLADTYVVEVFGNGSINAASNLVAVGCNQFVTANIAVGSGAITLAGKVTDSATGLGLAGMLVEARSTNAIELDVATFTDANGNYDLRVSGTNRWDVRPDKGGGSARGCLPPLARTKVPVNSSSVSNINFSLTNATALIYGTILDGQLNPVIGQQMYADDSAGRFDPRGRSVATNGTYCVGVVASTNWTVSPEPGELMARGYAVPAATSVALSAGQAARVDFVVTRILLPRLSAPTHSLPNQFQFLLGTLAGQTYTIQAVTNLDSTNWFALLATNAPCDTVSIQDLQATNAQRFYRAVVAP